MGISGRGSRESSYSNMKTLYDLLGALPDDDADELRAAFRKAVKATHPDSNNSDPDAPLTFRRIVRANAILSDPELRAGYDRMLALARRQPGPKKKRGFVSDTLRKLASDAIAVACLSVVFIGGYTLFAHISRASVIPVKEAAVVPSKMIETAGRQEIKTAARQEVAARDPAEIVAVTPTLPSGPSNRDESRDKPEGSGVTSELVVPSGVAPVANTVNAGITSEAIAPSAVAPAANTVNAGITSEAIAPSSAPPEANTVNAGIANEATAPSAAAPEANTVNVEIASETIASNAVAPTTANSSSAQAMASIGPAPEPAPKDAKSYREQGIFAYREGDLYRALADFDLAIKLDPGFAEAYIDRGIVLYRMREFNRAFADIAEAKRIENANRARTPAPHKASPASGKS